MMLMLAVVGVAATVAAGAVACTRDVFTAAATVAERVRPIPSQAAQGVPDIQLPVVPVVRAIRSRAEGIIADTDTVRRRWEPQRLVPRPMAHYNNCYDVYGNWICPGQYPY